MHSNESFSITEICETTTEPLFREILTAIINMHPGEYLFSDDYTRFKKTDTDQLEAARKIRENAYRKNDNEGDGETSSSTRVRPQTLYPSGTDLPNKKSVPEILAYEVVKLKFVHPEYFRPTKKFYRAVGLSQRQWWSAYRGKQNSPKPNTKHFAHIWELHCKEGLSILPPNILDRS